jgi:helicase associated protein
VLGAIDDDERLTPLGWWGLPEAMLRVWAPSGGGPGPGSPGPGPGAT